MSDFISTALDLTGGPIIRGAKKLVLEIRVVAAVRRQLARDGIVINSPGLRGVMYEQGFRERLARRPNEGDDLSRALAGVVAPSTPESIARLRERLVVALRTRLDGSTDSSEFGELRAEARHAETMSALSAADESKWESRLGSMPPLRAEQLRDIRPRWFGVVQMMADLSTATDQGALLRRWATYPPAFLTDAPVEVLGVLADIASEHVLPEVQQAGTRFVELGLARGLEPTGYWTLRSLNGVIDVSDLELAAPLLDGVRGYPLVEAYLHEEGIEAAVETLERWHPETKREELNRRVALAELYLASRRLGDGVRLSLETAELFDSTNAALAAGRALLARHMIDPSAARVDDLPKALRLAMDARRKRRSWGLESGSALALEIRIRRALTDAQGAFDLVNGTGEFPGTEEEFRHPAFAAEAALLQGEFGDVATAKRLLSTAPNDQREHISAVIAEREGRSEDAIGHWNAAIEAAKSFSEKADLSLRLAFMGVRSVFVDQLIPDNPEVADELTKIAALYSHQVGAVEEFRGFANANFRGTLFLCRYFLENDEPAAAAAVAREGAARWNDSGLWVQSARFRLSQGDRDGAIADLQAALGVAGDGWGGRSDAYGLLVETHAANGDWPSALVAAGRLLVEQPGSGAAWAVIHCQIRMNDLPAALQTWREQGAPAPQSRHEVASWIELVSEFGEQVGTPRDALRIAAQFATDEGIGAALLGAFLYGRERPDPIPEDQPDPDRDAFREMLSDYVRNFPNGAIRQVAVDMTDPLRSMQDLAGSRPQGVELEQHILDGTVPLGLASVISGRSYLESLLSRPQGPVFAATRDIAAEASAIAQGHEIGVVADLSALVTIQRSPEAIRAQLIGHFAVTRALSEQQTDAQNGARLQRRMSGMTFLPGADGEIGSISVQSDEELAAQTTLAHAVSQSFSSMLTDSHPQVTAFEQFAQNDIDRTFLLAADHAVARGLVLWADDMAMKELVRQMGGQAFGTPELLVHLREEGIVDAALIDLAEAQLVSVGYTGVRFHKSVWELARGLGQTDGLARAIRYAGNDSLIERAEFARSTIAASGEDPAALGKFTHAMAQWLVDIAPDPQSAQRNLRLMATDILRARWMSSSVLPYCINGFRGVSGSIDGPATLLGAAFSFYQALAEARGEREAALVVFELVSRLDPPDAYRVRAAVLSGDFE